MNTVQEQLGHYDAGFTASRYGHVTPKMKNSAAIKLGERLKAARGTEDEKEYDDLNIKEPEVIDFPTKEEAPVTKAAAWKIK